MPIGWSFFSCTRSTDALDPLLVDRSSGDDVSRTTDLHIKPTLTVPYGSPGGGTTTVSSITSLPSIRSTATPFRLRLSRGGSKMSFSVARRDPTALSFFSNRSHIAPSSLNVSCRSASSRLTKPLWFCSSTPCGTRDADQGSGDRDTTAHRTVHAKTPNVTDPNRSSSFDARDECHVPPSVLALFVYLAQQGVHVSDLFRRPGNISQMKQILECFTAGQPIDWASYNVYTVANVAKKLLLAIPGGLFGPFGEEQLLATAGSSCSSELDDIMASLPHPPLQPPSVASADSISIPASDAFTGKFPIFPSEHRTVSFSDDVGIEVSLQRHPSWSRDSIHQLHLLGVAQKRISVFLRVLSTLPPAHQEVAVIMLGILHQLVFHSASTGAKFTLSSMLDLHHPGIAAPSELPESQSNGNRSDSNPDIPLLTVAEGVVKSVAGTLFHTCCTSVQKVEQTAQVLRSLVLYFPSMGESIIRFYIDAVADRLTTTTSTAGGGFMGATKRSNQPVCILCPESGHANYFDVGPPVECDRRPCPTNLLHAASRLFCLNGSYSTPVGRKTGQHKHPAHSPPILSKPPSSSAKPRFVCPPFGCKIHASPTITTVSAPEIPRVDVPSDMVAVPSVCVTQCPEAVHEEQMAPSSPLQPSDGNTNTSNVALDHNTPRCTITLRRNQSRYKSLRRRQMENLSRRAEWFLGPTTLPIVTLHHPPAKIDLVVTSTVSLLDLDDSVVGESSQMAQNRLPSLLPPRLLFTASTGELGEPEFDSSSKCDTAATGRSEPARHRFPSVGSYLDPMHADSYISLHSAPSCGLHRFEDKDLVPVIYPVRYHPPELISTGPHQHPSRKEKLTSTDDQRCRSQSPVDMTTLTDCPNSSGPLPTPLPVGDEAALKCSDPLPRQTNHNALCSLLYRPYEDHQPSSIALFRAAEDSETVECPRRNSALPALQSLARPTEDKTVPHGQGRGDV